MPLKKIIGKIHPWPGLASELRVFILGITRSIWVFQEIRSWVYADRQSANSDAYTYSPFVEQASGDKIIKLITINFRVTGGEKAFGSFVEAPCKFQLALTPTLIPAKSPLSIVNQINHKPIINKERKIVNPRIHHK